ncbi:zinc finger protein [Aphelenchoides avenae]|nr:zinc finger protein [Aphelenchus avenae]
MDKCFSCVKCPKSFGRQFDLLRHLRTVHKLQRFHCAKCPKSYGQKSHLNEHVRRVHAKRQALQRAGSSKSVSFKGQSTGDGAQAQEGSRQLVCTVCKETFANTARLREHAVLHKRTDGIECPVCHVRVKTKGAFTGHMRKRHPTKVPAVADGIKQEDGDDAIEDSKPTVEPDTSGPPLSIKDETALAESLPGETAHMQNGNEQQKGVASATAKAPPTLVLRLRATVQFKTSSGRMLIIKNQPACLTFGDFRKLFCIPAEMGKLIVFKKSEGGASGADQWIVPDDDNMTLPLVDGCIIAETCTDF